MGDNMLKRKIYDKLLEWKKNDSRDCALLIDGARRVGKSFIVEEFAKAEYRSYVIIDFTTASKGIKDIFLKHISNLDVFFAYLASLTNVTLYERETLIVFDEVQHFPKAREAIKHLVKDGRYDYIETGSLVSINENVKDILIPSEERDIEMYPMDFEEFLWATGRPTLMDSIRRAFKSGEQMGPLHEVALDAFRQYIVVGGMPQAVAQYVESFDLAAVDRKKRDLLKLYRKGIKKHAKRYALRVERIYDEIPGQRTRHEKHFNYSSLGVNARYREYENAFLWLADAMVVNVAWNVADPNVGFKLNADDSLMKCYFFDTGLLISHAFDEGELISSQIHNRILTDDIELNEGMLVENVVAQMLVASGRKLYFYSRRSREESKNRMEIDFMLSRSKLDLAHNVIPIEVKSGKKASHKSLDKFVEKFSSYVNKPYLLWMKDRKIQDGVEYLPIYMTPCLAE
jgi:predicted AAA+ superfamily ATPase